MPARSTRAIVGDFANPIERPFFHSLRLPRSTPRHGDVSISFVCLCFPLPFFGYGAFLFNRYYAAPCRAPRTDSRSREPRNSQSEPTIREIFLPVAFVLPPLRTTSSTLSSFILIPVPFLRFISTRKAAKDNGTTRRHRRILWCLRDAQEKREMREIILSRWSLCARGSCVDNRENILAAARAVDIYEKRRSVFPDPTSYSRLIAYI